MLYVNEVGALCEEGGGFYFIAQDGDGGTDIVFARDDEQESLATFDDVVSAEEAYELLVQEAHTMGNVVALLNLELGHAQGD